jgi:benzaldehyde dehydrogenase (NAD)
MWSLSNVEEVSTSGLFIPALAIRVIGLVKAAVGAGASLLTGDLQVGGPSKTIIRPHILEGVTGDMESPLALS